MKFRITFKSPDGVHTSLMDEAECQADHRLCSGDKSPDKELFEEQRNEIFSFLKKFIEPWVEYGEYLTVEFDSELGTATVIKNR